MGSIMNFASHLYELNNCFDRHALQYPDARRKLHLFGALIPLGCQSILDVGGGTGWTTLALRDKYWVVTLDRSLPSLLENAGDRVLADASRLPFPDRSFDLVLCSQVLEHLPGPVFDRARAEMARVANECLMVSVPYRENLLARMVQCAYCGEVFHTDHHVRAFSEQDLATLFDSWTLAEWHVFGVLDKAAGVVSIRDMSRRDDKQPVSTASEYTVCPSCGRQGGAAAKHAVVISRPRRLLHRLISIGESRILKLLTLLHSNQAATFLPQDRAPYWVAALYFPYGSASAIDSDIGNIALARDNHERASEGCK